MNTPIAAVLWAEEARRDVGSLLRLLSHVEMACLDLGAEEAAGLIAEAALTLADTLEQRKMAA
ncbi:soj family protein [Humitalea sp. 24SJ18S-53]|uniref:soj family protein n=1 Tax=Humitalea sp. 24SJ18S-53 TaxID=3422307 RepID=UPI003D678B5C